MIVALNFSCLQGRRIVRGGLTSGERILYARGLSRRRLVHCVPPRVTWVGTRGRVIRVSWGLRGSHKLK